MLVVNIKRIYIKYMDIEFDPAKDTANQAKHGLSLADAAEFDLASATVIVDDRRDYGETRLRAFGRINGVGHCLVFTYTRTAVRVISFRRAHERSCVAMEHKRQPPVVFDEDNPEWTEEDFARARPAAEVLPPEVLKAFGKGKRGRPVGSTNPNRKVQVSLRVDPDVLAAYKSGGRGWQTRMQEALREGVKNRRA